MRYFFLFALISDSMTDCLYFIWVPVYDRLSVLTQIRGDKVKDGEGLGENGGALWLMYGVADERGSRVGRKVI